MCMCVCVSTSGPHLEENTFLFSKWNQNGNFLIIFLLLNQLYYQYWLLKMIRCIFPLNRVYGETIKSSDLAISSLFPYFIFNSKISHSSSKHSLETCRPCLCRTPACGAKRTERLLVLVVQFIWCTFYRLKKKYHIQVFREGKNPH